MLRGMNPSSPATWTELYAQIGDLAGRISALRSLYPDDAACLAVVRRYSDEIQARADHDEDLGHSVYVSINHMLVDAGLIAPEERQF
jgi:hypothetical protein